MVCEWLVLVRLATIVAAGAMLVAAQVVWKPSPTTIARRRTPLLAPRCCAMPKPIAQDQNGALALLLLGATEDDQHQFGDALTHLKAAAKRLPELPDYVAYFSAVAEAGLRQFNETEAALQPVWKSTPASALVTKAVLLQAESYLQGGNPAALSRWSSSIWRISPRRRPSCCWRALMRRRTISDAAAASIIKKSSLSIRCRRKHRTPKRRCLAIPAFRPRLFCARPEARSGRGLHASGQGTHRAAAALERRKLRPGARADRRRGVSGKRERIRIQISELLPGHRARRGSRAALLSAGMPAPLEQAWTR